MMCAQYQLLLHIITSNQKVKENMVLLNHSLS